MIVMNERDTRNTQEIHETHKRYTKHTRDTRKIRRITVRRFPNVADTYMTLPRYGREAYTK